MKNPVIGGYHADPFVYRDGGDYYCDKIDTPDGLHLEVIPML